MTAIVLFTVFMVMLVASVPVGVALGLAGTLAILMADQSMLAVATSVYTGIAKYPLIALPMFILVGSIFDRSGVALRLVRFVSMIVGAGRGALGTVTVIVAMVIGGISGSGPAAAAAVGHVVTRGMVRDGYPRPFIAATVAAAASTDILIPPSVAFIIYAVLVPGVSVPAIFAAGIFPGILVGLAFIGVILVISFMRDYGGKAVAEAPMSLWQAFKDAFWGLMAPVVILGGMRMGLFTPTEAAVAAVAFGLFIGFFVYRTLTLRDLYEMLVEAGELSGVILMIVAFASVFAWSTATLGLVEPITEGIVSFGFGQYATLILLMLLLVAVGMFLDGVSIYVIFVPIILPIAHHFDWDMVWLGIMLTMMVSVGQITPPMAVNVMVSSKIAGVSVESTVPHVIWMVLGILAAACLVLVFPDIALWLPRWLGY